MTDVAFVAGAYAAVLISLSLYALRLRHRSSQAVAARESVERHDRGQ